MLYEMVQRCPRETAGEQEGAGMVQLTQITTANASALLLLLILKLHMNRRARKNFLPDVKLLAFMINLTMFQCFFDTLVFWIDGRSFPLGRELNYIGNIFYYTLNLLIAYVWTIFTEYKLNGSSEKTKRVALGMSVPLAATALLVASTPFNGFVFTVTADNRYTRTSWHFFLPTILMLFYIIFGTVRIYIYRRTKGKYMIFPAIYFIAPIMLAVITQAFIYGISLIFIGIAIGLAGVYLSTQSESAYIDQLCEVYNRRYYNDYMRTFCNSQSGEVITGVLIDMDDFKFVNDCFGHIAGDEALMQFSSVLRSCLGDAGFAVRFGGDEFILITKKSPEEMERVVDEIQRKIEEINASGQNAFRMAFSYGIAQISAGSRAEEFLRTMDGHMYEMKKKRRSENVCAQRLQN